MAFSLALDTSGTGFDLAPRTELARILRAAADAIESSSDVDGVCRSEFGRPVGRWHVVGIGE